MIPRTITENSLTFFINGKQHTFASDHDNFDSMINALANNDIDSLTNLMNTKQYVAVASYGNVSIDSDDVVRFKGAPVPEYLANRIIAHFEHDPNLVAPLVAFAEKLMANPNAEVREDLYKWLERGNMPLYPDGDFLAYKVVQADFTPVHKGPYGQDQSPGKFVEMPRDECDSNRNSTCSTGLHFCSYQYLPEFDYTSSGRRVIVLKINPTDVTAIPTDYNLSKGRTCKFFVVDEIEHELIKPNDDRLVVDDYEDVVNGEDDFVLTKQMVEDEILDCSGNKTQAAKNLGIARSTLYRILNS